MPDDAADLSSPGGSGSPGPGAGARRVLEPLGEAEAIELLAIWGFGRLVYSGRYGPTALPVTYRVDAGSLVLGTWDPVLFDEDLRTGIAQAEYQVAVEADQIDVDAREGWVLLIRGQLIIWTARPSARRSPMPGSTRGSRGSLHTSSG
jgi:Pyridoxamine 5'-phosphate oxidase